MNKMKINIDYDKRFDTLYVALGNKSNSYGDDSSDGIILMRDLITDAITGFTILSFFKKYHSNSLPKLPDSLGFSIEKDIIPKIKQ
ncbi:hypothetical protein [Flavonifractor sp. An82]|uniref:hypothetical protein n=1 Tax=Flavonifractor sp. An82 TaxID=1965660 RepID=UPI0013A6278F|nr:hypothetical protein [Flavonifractor sp. An82]